MGFVRIEEMYPNEYILVRITEIDHDKGRETAMRNIEHKRAGTAVLLAHCLQYEERIEW
jgi:hypothetical protein